MMRNSVLSENANLVTDIINDPYNFTLEEIKNILGDSCSKNIYSMLYQNVAKRKVHTVWPKNLIKDTNTVKYLFELTDKNYIETVCIHRRTGVTACVSTQVGCPVRCIFCESGRNGLVRNLTASEIVQQILFIKESINRIVFMGIGEPLYNYDSLIKAIHILRERDGLDFPTDGISISTVGPIKYLKKLREEHIKIQLVLSLHATTQNTRDYLIPYMRENDINQIVDSVISYSERHNRKLTIAYLLLPGLNDKYSDIRNIVNWFKNKNVMINLLQLNNANQNKLKQPTIVELNKFKEALEQYGLEVKIREARGRNIKAACGQLASRYNKHDNYNSWRKK
jgi:23S rRNA (adenine2503-C2)-methyltransferase